MWAATEISKFNYSLTQWHQSNSQYFTFFIKPNDQWVHYFDHNQQLQANKKRTQLRKLTILFNRFRPNTVSSQLTFTNTFNGSEHLPSAVMVIKQGIELLRISPLNRKHKPETSSCLAEIGMSTDTREKFALLSIFNARLSQTNRKLSFTNALSPLSLLSSPMWSTKVKLAR